RCVRGKTMLIVPNCEEAKNNGELIFFHEAQPRYLKSMVAFCIQKVVSEGRACEAALVIDADLPGFFAHADWYLIHSNLEEFATRLALEVTLDSFVNLKRSLNRDSAAQLLPNKDDETPPAAGASSPQDREA